MDVVHARCAGIDVSKRDAKVCIRIAGAGPRGGAREAVTTWGAVTRQVLALRDHLLDQRVSCVVLEATGDYWKPFYYLLEDASFQVLLVNARHVKNLPGRKTDVSDAAWLAQLGAHGLVRGSFVPPAPIRQLRDLTRTRTGLTRARAQEIQRLEKLLEDAGIKLSAVAADISGVSGRAPSSRQIRASTPSRPSSVPGAVTVVSGGLHIAATSTELSSDMTEMSPGTVQPRRVSSAIRPGAAASSPMITAVVSGAVASSSPATSWPERTLCRHCSTTGSVRRSSASAR